jgi:LysM repeat protein
MYRKTMEIESKLFTYATRYGVDPRTARAVVIQESGGNAQLVSSAGAGGYFQVMPQTFRLLRVPSNIEAGIKYLAQLQRQFGREDYAVAAYNAGPGAVGKGKRPLPLETLQYVIGVGHYKSVLQLHEVEIRHQAKTLKLRRVQREDSWKTLAQAVGIPPLLLRLHNPFLGSRPPQAGALIAYPATALPEMFEYEGGVVYYTSRLGDSYFHLAQVFGVDLETFRRDNNLWRLQQLPVGMRLRVAGTAPPSTVPNQPLGGPSTPEIHQVAASPQRTTPSKRSNRHPNRVRSSRHTIRSGDTLERIARRHRTTVRALMQANGLRTSRIQAGTSLTIPHE